MSASNEECMAPSLLVCFGGPDAQGDSVFFDFDVLSCQGAVPQEGSSYGG